MYKNIIFDMGNVLLRFDRDLFMERAGVTGDDKTLLMREVYLSLEWSQMDRGSLTEKEAGDIICARVPAHLHDAVRKLVAFYDRPIIGFDGMYDLIAALKEKGYGIYLLSNASLCQHDYWPRLPESKFFDGTLISADVKLVKPQTEIYLLLCQKFGLRPHECLFIDDSTLNIEGAYYCGIDGIVFHGDVAELREKLAQKGVL